jgi:hypothetical protein
MHVCATVDVQTEIAQSPLVLALRDRIAERPNIKAYLASDRCLPWDNDSMM